MNTENSLTSQIVWHTGILHSIRRFTAVFTGWPNCDLLIILTVGWLWSFQLSRGEDSPRATSSDRRRKRYRATVLPGSPLQWIQYQPDLCNLYHTIHTYIISLSLPCVMCTTAVSSCISLCRGFWIQALVQLHDDESSPDKYRWLAQKY